MTVVTLADVRRQAGEGSRVEFRYRQDGVEYTTRLRLDAAGLRCPQCGSSSQRLHVHPRGRGLVCLACLKVARRYRE